MRFSEDFRQQPKLSSYVEEFESFYELNKSISNNFRVDPSDVIEERVAPFDYMGRMLWYIYVTYAAKYSEL